MGKLIGIYEYSIPILSKTIFYYSSNKKRKDLFLDDENDDTDKDRFQEKVGYNQLNTYFEDTIKKNENSYLFAAHRFEYLDQMPPFQIEIIAKIYETCVENYPNKEQFEPNNEADFILKKLQALLCSQIIPKQVIAEVNGFLSVNEHLRGNESLQSVIMGNNDAVMLLIDACPQCLLQFGKVSEFLFLPVYIGCPTLCGLSFRLGTTIDRGLY